MGILKLEYKKIVSDGISDYCLCASEFERFNSSILDLGDIGKEGVCFEALASVFDLEGFTSFCNQTDPHLVIPEYLNEFLKWLFAAISKEFVQRKEDAQVLIWCQFPFYAKFMGDGVLFLWDTENYVHEDIGNIVTTLKIICDNYRKDFLPHIRKCVVNPPTKLRCGIARGRIISIGDGKDFIGPCINVASRLQKIDQFSFAFPKRGFNLVKCFPPEQQGEYVLIQYPIRGIGEGELLFIRKTEFELLSDQQKAQLLV